MPQGKEIRPSCHVDVFRGGMLGGDMSSWTA